MKKFIALLLALALITGSALAYGSVSAVSGDTYIRTAPNLCGDTIDVLPEGDSARYLDECSVDSRGVCWYLVDYYGSTGWVSERYVSVYSDWQAPSGSAGYARCGTVSATGGDSNIRSCASLYGSIRGLFPEGAAATYLGSSCIDERGVRWDYIRYNGLYGWVSSRYTTLH